MLLEQHMRQLRAWNQETINPATQKTLTQTPKAEDGVQGRPEPPGTSGRGGAGAELGHCREGRLAMLRGPMSSRSLAPVSITWPSE